MKLKYSPTSPYVRKVSVCAKELGLWERLEIEPTTVWTQDSPIYENNPLGKVPCLVLDDGRSIFDSPVICEYLDALIPAVVLFPVQGEARWKALRFQAIADGIMDAAVLGLRETMRDPQEQSQDWIAHQNNIRQASLQCLENEINELAGGPLTIGQVAIACALSYLDLRYGDENWQAHYPKLAKWHDVFKKRPSMAETEPQIS